MDQATIHDGQRRAAGTTTAIQHRRDHHKPTTVRGTRRTRFAECRTRDSEDGPLNERATACREEHMKAPPLVETARLVLSAPVATDAEIVFQRYASDDGRDEVPGMAHASHGRRHARDSCFQCGSVGARGGWTYLIWARADGRLLGSTGSRPRATWTGDHRLRVGDGRVGKGYATEALTAVVEVATDIGVKRLYALVSPAAPGIMACIGEVPLRTGRQAGPARLSSPISRAGLTKTSLLRSGARLIEDVRDQAARRR